MDKPPLLQPWVARFPVALSLNGAISMSMALSVSCRIIAGLLSAVLAFALASSVLPASASPTNDDFANATVINGSSESTTVVYGSNVGASREFGEPFHGDGSASVSVWWSWTATSTRSISISTEGSSYDTLLGVYTGNAVTNLAKVSDNDDDGNLPTSRVLFRAIAGETYLIAVDGFAAPGFPSETGDIQLTVAPAGIPVAITWQATDVQNQPVRSSDLRDRVLLIDFWSITCPPCLEEMPHFVTLHNRLRPAGFQVVGLYKSPTSVQDVQAQIAMLGVGFPMAELTPSLENTLAPLQVGAPSTIQAFPTTYVFDKENRLVAQVMGTAKDLTYFENLILPLMRTSSSISLKAKWQTDGLHLSWPGADKGDIVESTSDLSSTNWTQVLSIFGQTGMTIPPGTGSKFYRVRRPRP